MTQVQRPEYQTEESWTKRELWGPREGLPWVFSRVLINKYMWGKYQRSGKDHLKRLEGTASVPHTELEMVTVPTSQSWPSHDSQGTDTTAEKSLVSVTKIILTKQTLLWSQLTDCKRKPWKDPTISKKWTTSQNLTQEY